MPLGTVIAPPPAQPCACPKCHVTAPPPATAEERARLTELLELARPTAGQQREQTALLEKCGVTEATLKLRPVLLAEMDKLEALAREEAEAVREEETACYAESAARRAIQAEILRLHAVTMANDFPEAQTYLKSRERVRAINTAKSQIAQMYQTWPWCFGLPVAGTKNPNVSTADLPVPIQQAMRELNITI
jgi:hypothetical protein